MNKEEIDKILSRLERIDHKEYSCSFEFADSSSFEETCMCFDERKKLANYIKELQQENEQLKLELLEKKCSDKDVEYQEKLKLQQRIDEAFKEIDEMIQDYINSGFDATVENLSIIKSILKGE